MDFWKGMICAQAFICLIYLFFGLFVYSYFGQYSASVIYQVINPKALRTFNNVINLLTGLIAAGTFFCFFSFFFLRYVANSLCQCCTFTSA